MLKTATRTVRAKSAIALLCVLLFSAFAHAADLPNAPQPNTEYSSGFGFDNQLYFMQGYGVALGVGSLAHRPWMGAVAGVGSCMAWRAFHDQGYQHDGMFTSNRMAFCGLGSVAGYVTNKWLFRVHRSQRD